MERFVVVYDIRDDRRRTAVHKTMKNYGIPVQESVFEVDLRPEDLLRLQIRLGSLLDAKHDSIIFYRMCRRCAEAATRLGRSDDPFASSITII